MIRAGEKDLIERKRWHEVEIQRITFAKM